MQNHPIPIWVRISSPPIRYGKTPIPSSCAENGWVHPFFWDERTYFSASPWWTFWQIGQFRLVLGWPGQYSQLEWYLNHCHGGITGWSAWLLRVAFGHHHGGSCRFISVDRMWARFIRVFHVFLDYFLDKSWMWWLDDRKGDPPAGLIWKTDRDIKEQTVFTGNISSDELPSLVQTVAEWDFW